MDKTVYLSCPKCPGKYPANKFTKCPTCDIDLIPEETKSSTDQHSSQTPPLEKTNELSPSQVQSGSDNVQAGRDVIFTVNEKEKPETSPELRKAYSKINHRMKRHRSELRSEPKLSYSVLVFGLVSTIFGVFQIKSVFIDYSQQQGAASLKVFISFFIDSVSGLDKTEPFIWFVGTVIFLGATIAIPVINIFQAWFHDDDFITEQKKLLKSINQKIMALGEKI